MLPVCVYDDGKGMLAPLTDLRPAFDVRSGCLTALERLTLSWGVQVKYLYVPVALADLTRERHPGAVVNQPIEAEVVLAVNGRWTGPFDDGARSLPPGSVLVERGTGEVIAGAVRVSDLARALAGDWSSLRVVEHRSPDRQVVTRPWHVRSFRNAAIRHDLRLLLAARGASPSGHAVHIEPSATVHSSAILDADGGSIVIDGRATVRPGAVVIGPAYIGEHSTVLERATIRANTAVGPWCKVNGEVSGVIFQGFANKAHDGFLGDSWVGEWVNLGAGTTNSNLLNTYGEIVARALPTGPNERTGEQFLGAILGDHTKTAICTRLMTGAVVHTGTMWAGAAALSGCVAPFTWATDQSLQRFRFAKFLEVARGMMARREVTPSAAYEARLAELHAASAAYFNSQDA